MQQKKIKILKNKVRTTNYYSITIMTKKDFIDKQLFFKRCKSFLWNTYIKLNGPLFLEYFSNLSKMLINTYENTKLYLLKII